MPSKKVTLWKDLLMKLESERLRLLDEWCESNVFLMLNLSENEKKRSMRGSNIHYTGFHFIYASAALHEEKKSMAQRYKDVLRYSPIVG